jgi:exonuclease III
MDLKDKSLHNLNQSKVNGDSLQIYHQNIRSLRTKTYELLSHLYPELPHVICLTEHHLNIVEKNYVNLEGYTIGAQFCRSLFERGGAITCVHNSLKFTNVDLSEYCKEKDIEICAVKLKTNTLTMYIITIYRAPSGNFTYFLQKLDNALKTIYTPSSHFIICGDLNVNYLVENEPKKQLNKLMLMYNLTGIIDFPTRINLTTVSAIDNIFIDISRFKNFLVLPFSNDLSDHDAQILTIKIPIQTQSDKPKSIRRINKYTISDFTFKLSNESWDSIFNNEDVNLMFNSFLNTYLRIFDLSFPFISKKSGVQKNHWITLGIKTSCKRKRELFLTLRNRNDPALKQYYKAYCKILVKRLKE